MRLALIASHPVQYYAPLFRTIAKRLELTVFYAHQDSALDQARAGFGREFTWDVDLLSGYSHLFLLNKARRPGLGRFAGVDTPEIYETLRSGQFDAVLVMGWYLKAFIQALYAAKRLGLPVLVRGDSQLDTPRSPLKRAAKEMLYPLFLRLFDAALVVGHRNREYWKHYGFPSERMFDSPHCVDTEWFRQRANDAARSTVRASRGIPAEAPVALFAGKLVEFKRPMDLVAGAAKARETGLPLHVLVAGSGPLESSLKSFAAGLGVPLHMLGFCNQSEMPAAYAAADVLVLPSNAQETWGLVVNEAIACGRRAIVSNQVGCVPDMANDPRVASCYPLGDIESLAARLVTMLSHPAESGAIRDVSESHSLEVAADGIVAAMREIVPCRGKRSQRVLW